ncbi:MAG TPA: hypothetical protein VJ672_16860 [Gemmatimonadaceae bacterium]|nr:hypothetical protein [Gemmatimonadaceae bacterium]
MLGETRAEEWRQRLGDRWRLHLGLIIALWFVLGFVRPIGDPDLPRHLALGEWIVRHGAVPFAEPWAWTRSGAPFYAYSWLPELMQYGLFRLAEETGLRFYNAMLVVAAGASMLLVGAVARWRPWTVLLLALLHVGITTIFAGGQRPGLVLLVTIPIAWWAAYKLLDAPRTAPALIAIAAANIVAANSHILFPAMLGPLALLFTRDRIDWRRLLVAGTVTVASWLVTPYALVWPAAFRINFGANPLFSYPTPIDELTPGFIAITQLRDLLGFLPLCLAFVPWIVAPRLTMRERVSLGILWLAGLGMFALAVRGLVIWWVLTLPLTAAAIEMLKEPTRAAVHRSQLVATYLVVGFLLAGILRVDADTDWTRYSRGPRSLPAPANPWVEPAAQWIECNLPNQASGRIFNTFDFGDYLAWRLPRYSVSIDGRNIFPDSVALAEGFAVASSGGAPLGPWRSADLAIVPDIYPVAAALDSARGWRRVLKSGFTSDSTLTTGLWIREGWWARQSALALPDSVFELDARSGNSYQCAHEASARR